MPIQTSMSDHRFRSNGASRVAAPMPPLTHHEIVGLIEPFARRGLHVDLVRTDRIKRCLVFKVIEHGDSHCSLAGLREDLRLENPAPNSFRLTRTLTLPSGLAAMLRTDGPDPREVLARIDGVPVSRQFQSRAGAIIALSHILKPDANAGADTMAPARMVLTSAEARIEGLTLRLKDSAVSGYPGDIDLLPQAGHAFEFPDDLLAVLGRGWGVLRRHRAGWSGYVNVRGGARERTQQLEVKFAQMVAHLAATLAEPPSRFHETRLRARWHVALRRATPMLIYAALLAGAGGMSFVKFPEGSFVPNLLLSTPSLLMLSVFVVRNRPRLEFPRLPRRLNPSAWRPAPIGGIGEQRQPAS